MDQEGEEGEEGGNKEEREWAGQEEEAVKSKPIEYSRGTQQNTPLLFALPPNKQASKPAVVFVWSIMNVGLDL